MNVVTRLRDSTRRVALFREDARATFALLINTEVHMGRVVIIDGDVIDHINRGSRPAADALRKLIDSGATVYISQQAFNEATKDPEIPRTACANKKLIEDLGIKVAPAGPLGARAPVYEKNVASSSPPLSQKDMMTVAQARAIQAEIWSFDKTFRKAPGNVETPFGVKVASESHAAYTSPGKHITYDQARALVGLKTPFEISLSGRVQPKPSKNPPTNGSGGPGEGGSAASSHAASGGSPSERPGTKSRLGMPDTTPDHTPSPSRAERLADGAELGLQGVNLIVQAINDSIQKARIEKSWAAIRPTIDRHLADDPSTGALILVRMGQREKVGAEHDSPLEHTSAFLSIEVEYGQNESEAWNNWARRARLDSTAGMSVSIERTFIPPRTPVDPRNLHTPFTAYGIATFAAGRASLLKVAWKGMFGFDELDDVQLKVPAGVTPRFLLLIAPSEIDWLNGATRHTTSIPRDWLDAAYSAAGYSRSVSVVDLDDGLFNIGHDTAAMVFPADSVTAALFATVSATRDNLGQLSRFVNFDKVRWVRPENVHVLRKFMEDEKSKSEKLVQYAPRNLP